MATNDPSTPTAVPTAPTGATAPPAAAPSGTNRTLMTAGLGMPGAPTLEPPGPPAQSEIGPTTYGGPKGPVQHGANDPVTLDAYANGHPADGIARQRQAAAARTGTAAPGTATTSFAPGQPQSLRSGQPTGTATTQASTATPPATTTPTTQRVRMLRDAEGHTANQELELPATDAQRLIGEGAAQAI